MQHLLRRSLAAVLSVGSVAAIAAPDTFLNGQSYWGQVAIGDARSPTVDFRVKHVQVDYGETVSFVDGAGTRFTWMFNGLDQRSVALAMIAPAGFQASPTLIHIGQNPLTRH